MCALWSFGSGFAGFIILVIIIMNEHGCCESMGTDTEVLEQSEEQQLILWSMQKVMVNVIGEFTSDHHVQGDILLGRSESP